MARSWTRNQDVQDLGLVQQQLQDQVLAAESDPVPGPVPVYQVLHIKT